MKKIEISESSLKAAFEVADENTRKVLMTLFDMEPVDSNKPNLKDYKSIRSYEDACEALGESIDEERLKEAGVPKHIIAQMKLELICKALWGGDVKIYPDPDRYRLYWYPWFGLYSQSEIDDMDDETRGCLLSATAGNGAYAGFGSPSALCRSSYSDAYVGFRLCLDTKEKAEYFGKQFLELWAEAMAFNFSVGERMKQAKKETIKMEAQA